MEFHNSMGRHQVLPQAKVERKKLVDEEGPFLGSSILEIFKETTKSVSVEVVNVPSSKHCSLPLLSLHS